MNTKIFKKISFDEIERYKLKISNDLINKYNKNLITYIKETSPDVLLVIKGSYIYPETIDKILKFFKTVPILWYYDNLAHIPNILNIIKYFKIVYVFDQNDVEILKNYKVDCKFLPLGYDPNFYKFLSIHKKEYDISFIGVLEGILNFHYKDRDKMLTNIIKTYPNIKLKIFGRTWAKTNIFAINKYKIKDNPIGKHINNYPVNRNEINTIYNRSKICLNIHRFGQTGALNPRTFEILGSGGFQLIDYRNPLEDFFDIDKEIACYKNEKELLEKIQYYLENEDERNIIAKRGYNKVIKKHTFKHRAGVIIKDLQQIM